MGTSSIQTINSSEAAKLSAPVSTQRYYNGAKKESSVPVSGRRFGTGESDSSKNAMAGDPRYQASKLVQIVQVKMFQYQ